MKPRRRADMRRNPRSSEAATKPGAGAEFIPPSRRVFCFAELIFALGLPEFGVVEVVAVQIGDGHLALADFQRDRTVRAFA
jgi:hypothetical protein